MASETHAEARGSSLFVVVFSASGAGAPRRKTREREREREREQDAVIEKQVSNMSVFSQ